MAKQHAAAAARNQTPIGDVLAHALPDAGTVLEIASGSGEHAVAFASRFPHLLWQPSDHDERALASISAWGQEARLGNLLPPIALDVEAQPWPVASAAAVVCINMIHISPWSASLALLRGAAELLAPGAPLLLYGPFRIDGVTAPSNVEFELWLRARDPRFGVRELRELQAAAEGFLLAEMHAMPANNHSLVFRRVSTEIAG